MSEIEIALKDLLDAQGALNKAKASLNNWINWPGEVTYYNACLKAYNAALATYQTLTMYDEIDESGSTEVTVNFWLPIVIAFIAVIATLIIAKKKLS